MSLFIRVPYFIGGPTRDPKLENYPYRNLKVLQGFVAFLQVVLQDFPERFTDSRSIVVWQFRV